MVYILQCAECLDFELVTVVVVNSIRSMLYVLGYVLFVGPPRTLDIYNQETLGEGELSGKPLWFVGLVELFVRLGMLLCAVVLAETVLTAPIYDRLRFDIAAGIVALVGVAHTSIYYVVLVVLLPQKGKRMLRVYRLLRNCCYAFLPGLVTLTTMRVWELFDKSFQPSGIEFVYAYLVTTMALFVIGIVEAYMIERRPLGLDRVLENDRSSL